MDEKILSAKLYRACLDAILAMGKDEFLKCSWFAFKKNRRVSQDQDAARIKTAA